MDAPLKNSSAGTKEWLEATRGWTISAYVESGTSANYHSIANEDVSQVTQPRPEPQPRRQEWPFGENIRDAIRAFRGK